MEEVPAAGRQQDVPVPLTHGSRRASSSGAGGVLSEDDTWLEDGLGTLRTWGGTGFSLDVRAAVAGASTTTLPGPTSPRQLNRGDSIKFMRNETFKFNRAESIKFLRGDSIRVRGDASTPTSPRSDTPTGQMGLGFSFGDAVGSYESAHTARMSWAMVDNAASGDLPASDAPGGGPPLVPHISQELAGLEPLPALTLPARMSTPPPTPQRTPTAADAAAAARSRSSQSLCGTIPLPSLESAPVGAKLFAGGSELRASSWAQPQTLARQPQGSLPQTLEQLVVQSLLRPKPASPPPSYSDALSCRSVGVSPAASPEYTPRESPVNSSKLRAASSRMQNGSRRDELPAGSKDLPGTMSLPVNTSTAAPPAGPTAAGAAAAGAAVEWGAGLDAGAAAAGAVDDASMLGLPRLKQCHSMPGSPDADAGSAAAEELLGQPHDHAEQAAPAHVAPDGTRATFLMQRGSSCGADICSMDTLVVRPAAVTTPPSTPAVGGTMQLTSFDSDAASEAAFAQASGSSAGMPAADAAAAAAVAAAVAAAPPAVLPAAEVAATLDTTTVADAPVVAAEGADAQPASDVAGQPADAQPAAIQPASILEAAGPAEAAASTAATNGAASSQQDAQGIAEVPAPGPQDGSSQPSCEEEEGDVKSYVARLLQLGSGSSGGAVAKQPEQQQQQQQRPQQARAASESSHGSSRLVRRGTAGSDAALSSAGSCTDEQRDVKAYVASLLQSMPELPVVPPPVALPRTASQNSSARSSAHRPLPKSPSIHAESSTALSGSGSQQPQAERQASSGLPGSRAGSLHRHNSPAAAASGDVAALLQELQQEAAHSQPSNVASNGSSGAAQAGGLDDHAALQAAVAAALAQGPAADGDSLLLDALVGGAAEPLAALLSGGGAAPAGTAAAGRVAAASMQAAAAAVVEQKAAAALPVGSAGQTPAFSVGSAAAGALAAAVAVAAAGPAAVASAAGVAAAAAAAAAAQPQAGVLASQMQAAAVQAASAAVQTAAGAEQQPQAWMHAAGMAGMAAAVPNGRNATTALAQPVQPPPQLPGALSAQTSGAPSMPAQGAAHTGPGPMLPGAQPQAGARPGPPPGWRPPPAPPLPQYPGLLFTDGRDSQGRPVVVINSASLPERADRDAALQAVLDVLQPLVVQPYVLVVVNLLMPGSSSSSSGATLAPAATGTLDTLAAFWAVSAYKKLARPYRKNVKQVVMVSPSVLSRMLLALAKPFMSRKADAKIKQIQKLQELPEATHGEVGLPALGYRFLRDARLLAPHLLQRPAGPAAPHPQQQSTMMHPHWGPHPQVQGMPPQPGGPHGMVQQHPQHPQPLLGSFPAGAAAVRPAGGVASAGHASGMLPQPQPQQLPMPSGQQPWRPMAGGPAGPPQAGLRPAMPPGSMGINGLVPGAAMAGPRPLMHAPHTVPGAGVGGGMRPPGLGPMAGAATPMHMATPAGVSPLPHSMQQTGGWPAGRPGRPVPAHGTMPLSGVAHASPGWPGPAAMQGLPAGAPSMAATASGLAAHTPAAMQLSGPGVAFMGLSAGTAGGPAGQHAAAATAAAAAMAGPPGSGTAAGGPSSPSQAGRRPAPLYWGGQPIPHPQ